MYVVYVFCNCTITSITLKAWALSCILVSEYGRCLLALYTWHGTPTYVCSIKRGLNQLSVGLTAGCQVVSSPQTGSLGPCNWSCFCSSSTCSGRVEGSRTFHTHSFMILQLPLASGDRSCVLNKTSPSGNITLPTHALTLGTLHAWLMIPTTQTRRQIGKK